jgi:hypothetical protein
MRLFVTALLIIGLVGMGNMAFAEDKGLGYGTAIEEKVENHGVMGIVNKTDVGYTLQAGEEIYLLEGEKLEDLVGKTVTVKGKLLKGDTTDTILVANAEITE